MDNAVLYKFSSFEKYMLTVTLGFKPRNSSNAMRKFFFFEVLATNTIIYHAATSIV